MNRSESITKIAIALVKAQSEMGNAVKDSKNPFFKSKYADLNSIREASLPVLNKNGITVLQPTTVIDGRLFVESLLLHESGEFISGLTEVVVAKQNDPQATGSGISYARRYGLQSLLNIGAEDDDSEAAMGRSYSKPATSIAKESVEIKATTNATAGTTTTSAVSQAPLKRSFRTGTTTVASKDGDL